MKNLAQIKVITNWGLLLFGVVSSMSGLILQINYHLRGLEHDNFVFWLDRDGWSTLHTWSSVGLVLFTTYHILDHWRWYKTVMKNRIHKTTRPTSILSILMVFVTALGFIPLVISELTTRLLVIEIHDKIALVFFLFLILHIKKRFWWYLPKLRKKNNQTS